MEKELNWIVLLAIALLLPLSAGACDCAGIATVCGNRQGKAGFHKLYHEPEFKSGNNGVEDCVKRQ